MVYLSRFGFDIDGDDFESAIKYATMTKNVVFQSLHCHFAQRNLEFWPQRVKGMLKLIDRFKIAPKTIDIGAVFSKNEQIATRAAVPRFAILQ
jgi:diaminopimelate decarboxylase